MKTFVCTLVLAVTAGGIFGCGTTDVPTENAPAAKGVGGVPVMTADQLSKLPPDRRAQIEQSQAALQNAASANQQRKLTGRMPSGG